MEEDNKQLIIPVLGIPDIPVFPADDNSDNDDVNDLKECIITDLEEPMQQLSLNTKRTRRFRRRTRGKKRVDESENNETDNKVSKNYREILYDDQINDLYKQQSIENGKKKAVNIQLTKYDDIPQPGTEKIRKPRKKPSTDENLTANLSVDKSSSETSPIHKSLAVEPSVVNLTTDIPSDDTHLAIKPSTDEPLEETALIEKPKNDEISTSKENANPIEIKSDKKKTINKSKIFYNEKHNRPHERNGNPTTPSLFDELFKNKKQLNVLELQSIYFKHFKKGQSTEKIKKFRDHYSKEQVESGIKDGTLFVGTLRMRSNNMSYVSCPELGEDDIVLDGWRKRNRALEGDKVVIQLYKDKETGHVVHILEEKHPRIFIGSVKKDQNGIFHPLDKKYPQMEFTKDSLVASKQMKESHLYQVRLVQYKSMWPICEIIKDIGPTSDFMSHREAIVLNNNLDLTPVPPELFPSQNYEVIPPSEYSERKDFRNTCIFTIDPATARDLDDAVSCKVLENGNYEIGVHISDVTYYLQENTPLDSTVSEKATTIYLVDKTYHMLPEELCLKCSLLPGVDKLTYSVFWEITKKGVILNYRFTRSIINSACQLSYDHAQQIIENPKIEFKPDEFPQIHGGFTINDIKSAVTILHGLATIFKKSRVEGGSLTLKQPKLYFNIGEPLTFQLEESKESNSLIEEFMLLANQTVARQLFYDFPTIAFLRRHPSPKNNIKRVVEKLKINGFKVNISSAGHLQEALMKFNWKNKSEKLQYYVLEKHLVKTLARAEYFRAKGETTNTRHYALNIDLYTHFTSPIRRYADIMVHRLLSASLGYSLKPSWSEEYVDKIARICNVQKANAKTAQDMSTKLYFLKYADLHAPIYYQACVIDVFESGIEVIVPEAALVEKIIFKAFSEDKYKVTFKKGDEKTFPNVAIVEWFGKTSRLRETLKMFSIVNVVLKKTKEYLKFEMCVIKPAKCK